MNYVPKSISVFLLLVSMASGLLAEGTAAPNATATPKAAATPIPGPTPIALPDIVAEASDAQNALQDINAELRSDPVKASCPAGSAKF